MAASGTWRQTMGGHRAQIVENCSFFSSRDAHIAIVLTREPLGNFKAIAVRSEKDGQREALLSSESAETVQKAYELLLLKSADAVQNYITTNGFAFIPCPKKIGEVLDDDEDGDDDDDDGVSSVSSASEIMDRDLDKDLGDSALSFDAESAYESMTEDEACAGYGRARGTHTSRNSRIHRSPKWVRYSSRSPRRDDPDFAHHEPPTNFPVQTLPIHRRRSTPSAPPTYKTVGTVRHVTSGPPMPPAGVGPVQPGTWKAGPGAAMPMRPPGSYGSYGNLAHQMYSDVPMGGMRPHPSQMLAVHGPPLPPTGRLVPPPPPGTMPPPAQVKHLVNNVNLNGNSQPGSSSAPTPPASMGHNIHPATTQAPPPSASSHSTPASSTTTHTSVPIKPPPPPAPAQPPPPPAPGAIDCRLCIRSRMPGTGDVNEQRMVVRTLPTRAHVRAAALRYVEYNPSLFRHLGSGSSVPPSLRGAGEVPDKHLRANVTRVVFGGSESYDLTTYGEDDLSRLCASVAGGRNGAAVAELPLFEVVVTNVGPAGSFFTLS